MPFDGESTLLADKGDEEPAELRPRPAPRLGLRPDAASSRRVSGPRSIMRNRSLHRELHHGGLVTAPGSGLTGRCCPSAVSFVDKSQSPDFPTTQSFKALGSTTGRRKTISMHTYRESPSSDPSKNSDRAVLILHWVRGDCSGTDGEPVIALLQFHICDEYLNK